MEQQSNKFDLEDPDGPEFNSDYDFAAESIGDEENDTDEDDEMIDRIPRDLGYYQSLLSPARAV